MSMTISEVKGQRQQDGSISLSVRGEFSSSGCSLKHKLVPDDVGRIIAVELDQGYPELDLTNPQVPIILPVTTPFEETIIVPSPVAENVEVRVMGERTERVAREAFAV